MEKVEFQTPRKEKELTLVGNFWEADSDAGIVMAHGFTGTKEQYGKFTKIAQSLNDADFNVLAFDFSGCGESDEDSITVEKEFKDLKSAIEFIRYQGINRIGLMGLSQGGLVSLKASENDIEAYVLMAPVTDSLVDYREKLSEWQRRELEKYGVTRKYKPDCSRSQIVFSEEVIKDKEELDQDKLLENVESPVLFIHGQEDSTVPIEHSRNAVEKLDKAEILEVEDDHYFEDSVSEVAEAASKFFSRKIPKT